MPTLPDRPKPSPLRRLERAVMGFVLGIMAFFIEKMVMHSLKRSGSKTPSTTPTPLKGSGKEIEHQP
jgi:hypothetical protein